MANSACRIREHKLDRGYRAVTLENQFLAITVLPEKGADIYSLIYKPRKMDVLWKSPWGLKKPGTGVPATGDNTEIDWLDHYEGGWQEIFPNGGEACEYKGAPLNFHGEASILPWDYTVRRKSASAVTVEFSVRLYRSPFLLRRSVTVNNRLPSVLIEETLTNEAEEEMHFMWGHHPAYGSPFLRGDCRIQVPALTYQSHEPELSSASRIAPGISAPWPVVNGKDNQLIDLRILPDAKQRVAEMGYLRELEEGWYAISNRKAGFGIGLAWPKEVFPYLWFWRELRGSLGYPWYGRCYVMALEPFNSISRRGLRDAVNQRDASALAPGASLKAQLAAVFLESAGEVESISNDGTAQVRSL